MKVAGRDCIFDESEAMELVEPKPAGVMVYPRG
jgi:hypothetical protein